ncbi:MAG: hypothetical protein ACK5WS_02400 [Alphaproteobacteria bacterium]|jgi:chromosomal replication initiation ATPase DnaA|nr:hypothetical protein [Candidatus Jidaibacter sp.]
MELVQQLLPFLDSFNRESPRDFTISLCNLDAYNAIDSVNLWPNNRMLLIGEEFSGKSTLAKIWGSKHNAVFLSHGSSLDSLDGTAIIVEDIDALTHDQWLFHLINICGQNSIALLMTSKCMPKYCLQDLQSRMNATFKTVIKSPDDMLIQILLAKYFSEYQILLGQEVINYISKIIDRSYASIKTVVDDINRYSMRLKKPVTINLVKEFVEFSNDYNMRNE